MQVEMRRPGAIEAPQQAVPSVAISTIACAGFDRLYATVREYSRIADFGRSASEHAG